MFCLARSEACGECAVAVLGWRDWTFAIKTAAAAILALYLAMWIDLPRPYWSLGTVYVTSQMLAGGTRSRAVYRVLGTVLGAAASVILVPNLVDAPELLTLAIALWVAVCLYFALLDRTPRSYLMMLGGYTAALIGFASVGEPGTIFDTAVARSEEITLGILCASLVNTIVLPQPVRPAIAARFDAWLGDARGWVAGVLGRSQSGEDVDTQRLRLAADVVAFDVLATPLHYEPSNAVGSATAMATLRQHMLMYLPVVSAITDRIGVVECDRVLPVRLRVLLDDTAAWIASGNTDAVEAARLQAAIDAVAPTLGLKPAWSDLMLTSLAACLRDLIDLRQDIRLLQRHIVDGTRVTEGLAFRCTAAARTIRHRDHGMALLSAAVTFLVILITSWIWIATGWPDGSGAPMLAAVGCCLFAAQDDPAPPILGFANATAVGALVAGIYLFGVLPLATSFEMLAIAMAPALILCGLCMTQPRTASAAMGAAVNGSAVFALQSSYTSDFTTFANTAVADVLGMWVAVVVTRLVRSVGADWSVRRLRALNRRDLARAADRKGAQSGLELAAIMLDRVGLLVSRLSALPHKDEEWTSDLIAEVQVGIATVELHRDRRRLSHEARKAVEHLLVDMARHFYAPAPGIPTELLASIDATLDAVAAELGRPAHRNALVGLVGIRRGLFPKASPYRSGADIPTQTVLAA